MKLLVDHNLSHRIATALHAVFEPEHEVVALKAKFGRSNLSDEEWIEALGKEGSWSVLSGDRNIARKQPSRELFTQAGLVGFFVSPALAKLPVHRQCARFMTLLPVMADLSRLTSAGLYEIPQKSERFRQITR